MPRKTLKQCLKESNALLQPPEPLPTSPDELARRLGVYPSTNNNTAELQFLVGKRCLELLEDIHAWLEKEYWPATALNGLGPSDCELHPLLLSSKSKLMFSSTWYCRLEVDQISLFNRHRLVTTPTHYQIQRGRC